LMADKGYEIVSSIEDANIAIINTCGFIGSAVDESIETILEITNKKYESGIEKIFVMGCLVQRHGYKLKKTIPEVDAWFGVGCVDEIISHLELRKRKSSCTDFIIKRPRDPFQDVGFQKRIQSTPPWTAYLKIADGCSNSCSYCTIPFIRGAYRSRSLELIISDAEEMARRGVKEINLVAQDTTMYGKDLEGEVTLEILLEELAKVEGIIWIRLLYCHPWKVRDSLLDIIDNYENICPYIDIPLQHVNSEILEKMNRIPDEFDPYALIERIRSRKRDISIRTTLMVGFPGEGKKEFKELMDFVRWAEIDHLGAFIYNPEKGTRAERFKDRVDLQMARERLNELMALQQEISLKKNKAKVGTTQYILIEGVSDDQNFPIKGRTSKMAPDVDGEVYLRGIDVIPGSVMPVSIVDAREYDLFGEVIRTER